MKMFDFLKRGKVNPDEYEAGLEQTKRLTYLLRNRKEDDLEWQRDLSETFLRSLFDYEHPQPFFIGPDGFRYFGFRLPGNDGSKISVTWPHKELNDLVKWTSGAVILTPEGDTAYVYSPGDIISLLLYGTVQKVWQGAWGQEPNKEIYATGGPANIGRPNSEMFHPLVARCMEFYLSHFLSNEVKFANRTFGIMLIRPISHVGPEDSSELNLNIFSDDFPLDSGATAKEFTAQMDHMMPRHLQIRFVRFATAFQEAEFTPLKVIFEEAGLEPGLASH